MTITNFLIKRYMLFILFLELAKLAKKEYYVLGVKMYKAININRKNLTIMGVQFSDIETLENTANAIGSNMYEGYEPTKKGIELIRDYTLGKITLQEFSDKAKKREYV